MKESLAIALKKAIEERNDKMIVSVAKKAFDNDIELEEICDENSESFAIAAQAIGRSGWIPGIN